MKEKTRKLLKYSHIFILFVEILMKKIFFKENVLEFTLMNVYC